MSARGGNHKSLRLPFFEFALGSKTIREGWFGRPFIGQAAAAVIGSSVLMLTSASGCLRKQQPDEIYIPPTAPPEVAALLRKGDIQALSDLGTTSLKNNLGHSFPQIEGRWRGRTAILPDDYRGKKLAVLFAGGPCSLTLDWLDRFDETNWTEEGYDVLVVLTLTDKPDEVTTRIPPRIEKYEVDFPLPGYLAYAYWYPTMYYVSADGVFEGYRAGPGHSRSPRLSPSGPGSRQPKPAPALAVPR